MQADEISSDDCDNSSSRCCEISDDNLTHANLHVTDHADYETMKQELKSGMMEMFEIDKARVRKELREEFEADKKRVEKELKVCILEELKQMKEDDESGKARILEELKQVKDENAVLKDAMLAMEASTMGK